MNTKTSPIIISNVMISEMNQTLTFREITEPAELEKAFRLRYEEYSNARNRVLLNQNIHRMDINIYDLHSKHFGVFSFSKELIGYIRVVFNKSEFYNQQVFEIGKKYEIFSDSSDLMEHIKNLSDQDYPFLSYPNLPESVKSCYYSLTKKNESVAEGGRLIIKEKYRGLRTSTFLIECAMMLFVLICKGQKHAVLCCDTHHLRFYKNYGFEPFGDEAGFDVYGTNKVVMIFPLSLSKLSKQQQLKFEQMAIEFSQTNKISRAI